MKSKQVIFIGLCFLLLNICGCINDTKPNNAIDIIVNINGDGDYVSIQDAIESCETNDLISVSPGFYEEHIFINNSLQLIGDDPDHTIINGLSTDDVIQIKADNVHIDGFTIQNSGTQGEFADYDAGVDIEGNKTHINNCIIKNNFIGMEIRSKYNTITNCTFYNNTDGLYILISDSNLIKNNIFDSNNQYGLYLYFSSYNTITNTNVFSHNSIAFRIKNAQNNKIIGNIYKNNEYGIYFCCGSANNKIYYNSFINNSIANGYDLEKGNTWYDTQSNRGNYWDDYDGVDINDDGIGEEPYVISDNATSQDSYPFINPIQLK